MSDPNDDLRYPPVLECLNCGSRWLVEIIGNVCPKCGSEESKEGKPLPYKVTVSKCTHRRLEKTCGQT